MKRKTCKESIKSNQIGEDFDKFDFIEDEESKVFVDKLGIQFDSKNWATIFYCSQTMDNFNLF